MRRDDLIGNGEQAPGEVGGPATPPVVPPPAPPVGGEPAVTPPPVRNPAPPRPSLGPPSGNPEPRLRTPRRRATIGMPSGAEDAGGTFARPGTRGARPFRTGQFAQNRFTGPARFGPGSEFAGGGDMGGAPGFDPLTDDDMYRGIADRLLGG